MLNHKYIVKNIKETTSGILLLDIATKNGLPVFSFKPGQYLMVSYKSPSGEVPDKHAFSIASSPTSRGGLSIGIKVFGRFTQGIAGLKTGDEIYVSGPFGDFFFDERKHKNLVMIAGGIGITPFMSVLQYAADKNLPNKMYLLYSSRTVQSISFLREIKELEARNRNIKTLFSVTDERTPISVGNFLNERFSGQTINNFIGGIKDKTFFLCGPLGFMEAIKKELSRIGVSDKQIFSEEFSMIPDTGFWLKFKNLSYATGFAGITMLLPLYFIYNAGSASALPPFYDSSKVYNAIKSAYEQMISGKNSNALNMNNAGAAATTATNASTTQGNNSSTNNSSSVKTVKTKTTTVGTVSTNTNSAPIPVTHASAVASQNSNSLAINNSNAPTNQPNPNSPSVPQPVTSASGVVSSQTTPSPTTQNVTPPSVNSNSTNPTTTPTPVTSASGVVTTPPPTTAVVTPTGTPTPVIITPTPTNRSTRRERNGGDD